MQHDAEILHELDLTIFNSVERNQAKNFTIELGITETSKDETKPIDLKTQQIEPLQQLEEEEDV